MGLRHTLFFGLAALPAWGAAVSLRYESAPGLRCPDESALRQLVAARLGSDPFLPDAASVVTVKVLGGAPVQAEVALESPGNPTRRKLLSGADCTELMQSVDALLEEHRGRAERGEPSRGQSLASRRRTSAPPASGL